MIHTRTHVARQGSLTMPTTCHRTHTRHCILRRCSHGILDEKCSASLAGRSGRSEDTSRSSSVIPSDHQRGPCPRQITRENEPQVPTASVRGTLDNATRACCQCTRPVRYKPPKENGMPNEWAQREETYLCVTLKSSLRETSNSIMDELWSFNKCAKVFTYEEEEDEIKSRGGGPHQAQCRSPNSPPLLHMSGVGSGHCRQGKSACAWPTERAGREQRQAAVYGKKVSGHVSCRCVLQTSERQAHGGGL